MVIDKMISLGAPSEFGSVSLRFAQPNAPCVPAYHCGITTIYLHLRLQALLEYQPSTWLTSAPANKIHFSPLREFAAPVASAILQEGQFTPRNFFGCQMLNTARRSYQACPSPTLRNRLALGIPTYEAYNRAG